jgi:hypothetical protein
VEAQPTRVPIICAATSRAPYPSDSGCAIRCEEPSYLLLKLSVPPDIGSPGRRTEVISLSVAKPNTLIVQAAPQCCVERSADRTPELDRLFAGSLVATVVRVVCEATHLGSPCYRQETKNDQRRRLSERNIRRASWRHSADTATNACRSKVIGRRFYDVGHASPSSLAALITKSVGQILAGKWSVSPAKERSTSATSLNRETQEG